MRFVKALAIFLVVGGVSYAPVILADDFDLDALFDDIEADLPDVEPDEPELPDVEPYEPEEPEEETEPVPMDLPEPADPEIEPETVVEPEMSPEEAARAVSREEEIRRQAMEVEGLKALESGFRAMRNRNYSDARDEFRKALENIPDRPATRDERDMATEGLADAHYRIAQDILREDGNLRTARQNVDAALNINPDHRGALFVSRRIAREEARRQREAERPVPVDERPEIAEKRGLVTEILKEARRYFDAGELDRAEQLYEAALIRDEYNVEAMRFLRRIDEKKRAAADRDREATTERMMREVREAWTPPRAEEVDLPPGVGDPRPVDDVTEVEELRQKLNEIIIPRIEFRDANIRDVISFLVDASERLDPDREGVNIILHLPGERGNPSSGNPSSSRGGNPSNPWGDWDDDESDRRTDAPTARDIPSITLNLRRVSLMEAIRYITEVTGLRFRVEERAVVITSPDMVTGIVTRMYPVQPSFVDIIAGREAPAEDRASPFAAFEPRERDRAPGRTDVKEFFEQAGVPFPTGTSITYNPTISQLIVANTPENLERFERILAQLNVVPSQVEIEARFVEVAQDDLRELGLQWILQDDYQFMQRGTGPVGGRERIQVDGDPSGITSGLRFFGLDGGVRTPVARGTTDSPGFIGDILSVSSVLTNPELQVVLHALDQEGNVDLLSAPRVTTRSGINARIEVVSEIIYPTEFDIDPAQTRGTGDLPIVTPPVVTPRQFETRRTGVILDVTPTVGPDGYTIDLALAPEVAELIDWIQYGSSITLPRIDPVTGTTSVEQFVFNIPQPVFASRNVTTSIVIWDGQTVVMGGLIRERLTTVSDKIPLLGDIPLIGRLFRTEASRSRKENLLIFVTARLVDPAGKPIHRAEAMDIPGVGAELGEP